MKAKRILALPAFLGGWLLIVFFIALLTFIFSFLGTILCAVLAGMMCGTLRMRWWKAAAISPLFPAVLVGVLRASKTEMLNSQILVLGVLSFGTFWATYALARALFSHESKAQGRVEVGTSGGKRPASAALLKAAISPSAGVQSRAGALTLALLQGKWLCRNRLEGELRRKRMSIEADKLTLQTADAGGQFNTLAEAQIRLCTECSLQTVLLAAERLRAESDTLVSI